MPLDLAKAPSPLRSAGALQKATLLWTRAEVTLAGFNRRMRKTACPVVWKGCRAHPPQPHPIGA